jgi:ATP-binding cassette subfamily B protein
MIPSLSQSSFLQVLPDDVAVVARDHFGEPTGYRIVLRGDILPDGTFGDTWFIVNDTRVGVIACAPGAAPVLVLQQTLEATDQLSLIPGLSAGVVELTRRDLRERLLRVSNARQKDFGDAVQLINLWIKEKAWKPEQLDARRLVCSRCGRPLPDTMTVCPHCLDKRQLILRVLAFLKPYKLEAGLLFLFMIASSLVGLVSPYLGKILIDEVLAPLRNFHWLPFLVIIMVILVVIQTGIDMLTGKTAARIGAWTICDVRATMFHRLQELSLAFHARHSSGALITRVNQDTGQLQTLLVEFIPYGISCILTAIGILALLLHLSWFLTLFVLAPIVGIVVLVWKVFPRFHIYWTRTYEQRSRLAGFVDNVVNGVRVVKVFAQEQAERGRFDRHNTRFRDTAFEADVQFATFIPLLHLIVMICTPTVWLVGGILIFKGRMTLGGVVAFTGYIGLLFRPVIILTRLAQLIPNTLAAAGRVFDIIDTEPEIADAPDAVPMPDLRGEIELRDVSFGYDSVKPILQNVSLHIAPREMVGLVGPSGAGKSTTINLICRLFDVSAGQILVDGVDIRKIRYSDLRRQIGMVMQETFLLSGTIAENIAYARPSATMIEIIQAAKAANAHDFIIAKPDGYDTEITQGGANLSTGEKQRLSIARAILCKPKILILDEATASVDLETEKAIQEAIARLVSERTTIAIAHRLSTLRNARRLVVMEKGKVVECGTHEELLKKEDGVYNRLAKLHQETSNVRVVDR